MFLNEDNGQQIILSVDEDLFYKDEIKVSYQGTSVKSGAQSLVVFSDVLVENKFQKHFEISEKIQAEDFMVNNGFELEDCTDTGGGKNTAYAADGDYLDYLLYVPEAGSFNMDFRLATSMSAEILIQNSSEGEMVDNATLSFGSTGGWQKWETKSTLVELPAGKVILRLYSQCERT